MEALSKMMDRAVNGDLLKGFDAYFRHNNVTVTQLLFVDDTLVFYDADVVQLDHLHQILNWFQVVSVLKINLSKCEITPVGLVDSIEELAQVLNCKVGTLSISYLGLLLGASSKDIAVWNSVIERVEKRLAGWQKRYLLKGGHKVLIKSTLSSIPTYFMSLLQALGKVTERMERLQCKFLWDTAEVVRNIIL
ncbi:uncharacterized protein LOC132631213 [Lycium barbarum]|uniref:uncharacterized protein LOC132631213 n=1 Tax=Lycium barbarum TaxID=112863 RepID=UPI00293E09DF|nr:uncharacterized protein LOC132631213 [Lycium barbarum]